jgi:tetratricopeptide (TPR) repeat protein
MAFDVYQPCPFCTDRKLKFCCADIAEDMEKVARLSENGQNRQAMKILDKLAASHPSTVWNEATRATLLLSEGQVDEGRAVLEKLHAAAPENQAVIALLATADFSARGYEAAREAIWRAFRKATGYADLVSSLAMGIAGEMFDRKKYLAARQHLTLAMRLAPPRDSRAIFVRLLEFDGNADIPFPLRNIHSLREISGGTDRQDATRKAMRLAERGCFGPAAERFVHFAQETPDDAAIEYNIALCTAWEGDDEVAAEAFGRAALAEPDFELAAEYAALEQLLRANSDDRLVRMRNAEYRVPSASRLITDLDNEPRCVKVTLPPEASGATGLPDAVFELLDRPVPDSLEGLAPNDLPRAVGQIAIFGSPEDAEEPRAALAAFEGKDLETARAVLAEAAPYIELLEDTVEEGDATLSRELAPLHARLAFPEKTPVQQRRELERRYWEQSVETWLNTPQEALIGKTPLGAVGDEGLRVPLAGAIHVLDAFCLRYRYTIDLDGLRRRLSLPEVTPVEARPDLPLNTFSAIQLHRLKVVDLDDRQLAVVINRALLVHHGRFLRIVLEEALRRSLPEIDKSRVYMTLSDLARDAGDTAGALHWIEAGRKEARTGEHAFENVFRWDTKELGLRLEDPESPDLQPFVRRMSSYYGPKVPRFSEYLDALLQSVGITAPTVLEPVGAAAEGGGLWTPDQPAGGAEKKLWLPGT